VLSQEDRAMLTKGLINRKPKCDNYGWRVSVNCSHRTPPRRNYK